MYIPTLNPMPPPPIQNPRIIQAYLGTFVDILENQSLPLLERVVAVAKESGDPTHFLITRAPGLLRLFFDHIFFTDRLHCAHGCS